MKWTALRYMAWSMFKKRSCPSRTPQPMHTPAVTSRSQGARDTRLARLSAGTGQVLVERHAFLRLDRGAQEQRRRRDQQEVPDDDGRLEPGVAGDEVGVRPVEDGGQPGRHPEDHRSPP